MTGPGTITVNKTDEVPAPTVELPFQLGRQTIDKQMKSESYIRLYRLWLLQ